MFKKRRLPQKVTTQRLQDAKKNRKSSDEETSDDVFLINCDAIDSVNHSRKKKLQTLFSTQKQNEKQIEPVKSFFESSVNIMDRSDQKATATYEHDTEKEHDHRAILERNEKIGKAILEGELEEGIYRGAGALRPVISRREGAISSGKYSGLYGPVRGNQHVRMTMRIDLNPEICKDYKETGYCGFGDTCIFLHDRSDYKPGWMLEKEWEEKQREIEKKKAKKLRRLQNKNRSMTDGNEECSNYSSDSDSTSTSSDECRIPNHCLLCNKKWVISMKPVVTQCSHYFCEACALAHYSTSSKCASCAQPTHGVFNTANAVLARLKNETR